MRIFWTCLMAVVGIFQALGQSEWRWPEDQDLFVAAKEKQAFYKVSFQLDNYEDALGALHWLYANNPDLNESIYIDGVKIIEKILKEEDNAGRRADLEDSLLWMYDQRIVYFEGKSSALDRKAYSAFKLYYKNPSKFPLLDTLYAKAFNANGSRVSTFNLTPYMTLAKYYHQSAPGEMPPERVLDIHTTISEVITGKMNSGTEPEERLLKEQDKVDALLNSMDNILNCEFIGEQLAPRLDEDSTDLNTAKKVFSYSLKAKCGDQPYFTRAGDIVFKSQPTYELAAALGNRYLAGNEVDKAVNYFVKSLELADMDEQRYEAYINVANVYVKTQNKPLAREMVRNALSIKPQDKKAFNIIGNLYFGSFEECKGGESKVMDRAIFIAAYNMYDKAGNEEQMAAAREQFPSIEEIFSEDYEESQVVEIGCWIGETVKLQRRD